MKKKFDTKALIKDITDRGYVLIDNIYYPPNHHKSIGKTQKKTTKKKSNKTGWIDDSRNAKCLQKVDSFTNLILLETGLVVWSEFHFSVERRWRIDYCIPVGLNGEVLKLALEIEGAVWTNGRHTRPQGFLNDVEKYNELAKQGWTLQRFVPNDLKNGKILNYLKSLN